MIMLRGIEDEKMKVRINSFELQFFLLKQAQINKDLVLDYVRMNKKRLISKYFITK